MVGIPSRRWPPSGLAISTRRTGEGRYCPVANCFSINFQCPSLAQAGNASIVKPSMPAAPLLARTCFHAFLRFAGCNTCSSSKGWLCDGTLSHVATGRYSCAQVCHGSSFGLSVQAFTVFQPLRWMFGYYAVC